MGRFKKVYLAVIVFLFQNMKLTDGDLGTSKDTDEWMFSELITVHFNKNSAIITDEGEKITSFVIFAYLERSKIKFEPRYGEEALRIEKGALKVVVCPFKSYEELENLGKSTLLGYLKLKEDWVSETKSYNYCDFKTDPVFIWEKQLVLTNLDSQGSVIGIENAEFSDFKMLIFRLDHNHKANESLKIMDVQTRISFTFSFLKKELFFAMELTNIKKGYISDLEKLILGYEFPKNNDGSESSAYNSTDREDGKTPLSNHLTDEDRNSYGNQASNDTSANDSVRPKHDRSNKSMIFFFFV